MFRNAFAYITRKSLKSSIILLIVLAMSTLSFVSLAIKGATTKASKETFKNITNSFSMEINRRVNPGTPRGGGNIKGEDIKKIIDSGDIDNYVKRISSVADLEDKYELIETEQTLANKSPKRQKYFNKTVMMNGINDSSKEKSFISETYKLVEGKHLNEKDKHKILMHKDLASKNKLKVGDKIKLKSNIYDPDNEKKADKIVEVEIKGLFDGHNKNQASVSAELYENNLITDLDTAAEVYGNTQNDAPYMDATFFTKGDKNLDEVIKKLEKLPIDWQLYSLIKSSSNYPALQKSISGIYGIANSLFVGSLVFSGIVLALLLFLWINARRKEIGILLSIGISKIKIICQFAIELIMVSIPAFIGSYFLASFIGKSIGNKVLSQVTTSIAKQIAKDSAMAGVAGGAEVDGFNKTLTSLNVIIEPKNLIYVVLFGVLILAIALAIASINILRKHPKELLTDIE